MPVEYENLHPLLQEYYKSFERTVFRNLIGITRTGGFDGVFIRKICNCGDMLKRCKALNVNPDKIADLIILYGNVLITENDIEYYTKGV